MSVHSVRHCWCSSLLLLLVATTAHGFQISSSLSRRGSSAEPRSFLPSRSHLYGVDVKSGGDDAVPDYDIVICGAGPGGLLLASALSKRAADADIASSCKIAVIDPTLDQPWPNNYGVWMDEAEYFGYGECCDAVWKEAGVVFDEDTPELKLDRPYGRIDRKTLKARLMQECANNNNVDFHVAKATHVEHFTTTNKASEVTIQSTTDGLEQCIRALLVVDATGFSRKFVKHEVEFDPGYQVTYGARFRVKDLGPYKLDRMVLMDYSERHLYGDAQLVKSNDRFPSFVYVMPLAEDELFMEETVLVSRPAASSKDLQRRLEKRMEALGIEALEVLEDERAAIPMGGMDPIVPQRTLGFGATASLVHPASGYMVARAMEVAPRVADAVIPKIEQLKRKPQQQSSSSDNILSPSNLDDLAAAGWDAVWPTDERRQRDFMHFGFELLCLLSPQELRDFFTGFFRLPDALWEHFLSWRLSGVGHVVMGLRVWAQCIPRRFMPAMLLKSLPFLGNRLVFPSLSRGNFAKFDTSSVYADARTGNSTLWVPDSFYPYVQELKTRSYGEAERTSKRRGASNPTKETNEPEELLRK